MVSFSCNCDNLNKLIYLFFCCMGTPTQVVNNLGYIRSYRTYMLYIKVHVGFYGEGERKGGRKRGRQGDTKQVTHIYVYLCVAWTSSYCIVSTQSFAIRSCMYLMDVLVSAHA